MKNFILPRKDGNGRFTLSWSQYDLWKSIQSFNLKQEGKIEYIVKYFLGFDFPDEGWAEFGRDVEDYITKREGSEKFTEKEIYTLEKIEPLGVFQRKIKVEFKNFDLIGFIDDESEDGLRIRDYKTASLKSSEKYRGDFKQTQFYCLDRYKRTGDIPDAEICVIERRGSCLLGKGRKALTVGDEVVYIPKIVTEEQLNELYLDIEKVAEEISTEFQIFKKINK